MTLQLLVHIYTLRSACAAPLAVGRGRLTRVIAQEERTENSRNWADFEYDTAVGGAMQCYS